MKQINPRELSENFIDIIGHEFMLVTAGTPDKFNTMTASWGGVGYLWNKPVAVAFVRPERYTYEFMEQQPVFTLSFLGKTHKEAYKICGTQSGRDIDKVKTANLHPVFTPQGGIFFEEMRLGLECRTLYTDMLKADQFKDTEVLHKWYDPQNGLHRMYVAEITGVFQP